MQSDKERERQRERASQPKRQAREQPVKHKGLRESYDNGSHHQDNDIVWCHTGCKFMHKGRDTTNKVRAGLNMVANASAAQHASCTSRQLAASRLCEGTLRDTTERAKVLQ